jgi:hypothetical protein
MVRLWLAVAYLLLVALVLGLLEVRQEWPWGVVMVVVPSLGVGALLIAGDENVDRLNPYRRRPRAK